MFWKGLDWSGYPYAACEVTIQIVWGMFKAGSHRRKFRRPFQLLQEVAHWYEDAKKCVWSPNTSRATPAMTYMSGIRACLVACCRDPKKTFRRAS